MNQHIIPDLATMRFDIMIISFLAAACAFQLGVWRASRAVGIPLIELLGDVADPNSSPVAPMFSVSTSDMLLETPSDMMKRNQATLKYCDGNM